MRNVKVVLEYDGTRFYGFQRQPGRQTIQSAFERALSKLFGRKIKIQSASGRTDSGVHAAGQVINFKVDTDLKLYQIERGLNHYLPKEIAVMKAEDVDEGFHARFCARSKIYEYSVWHHSSRSPLTSRYAHHVYGELDLKKMRVGARILTGHHDFRSFSGSYPKDEDAGFGKISEKERSTERTVKRLEIYRSGHMVRFVIEADGFLYHMVRNIVGTLLELGRGKLTVDKLKEILKARDRRCAGMTAPACGLKLVSVTY
jgi:tRNA pseudouridine38-40 synthase